MSTAPNPYVLASQATAKIAPSAPTNASVSQNLSDILDDLGRIPAERLLAGTTKPASFEDLAAAHGQGNLCELVEGFLVERAMGYRESLIAMMLGRYLIDFVSANQLGVVSGADGFFRLSSSLVRGPDAAFISWDRLPDRKVPDDAYPAVVPELVVEVISASNTRTEMTNKRREYFSCGVKLVWIFDLNERSVAVWRSMIDHTVLGESHSLDGEDVLPGLIIPLAEVFKVLNGPDEVSI